MELNPSLRPSSSEQMLPDHIQMGETHATPSHAQAPSAASIKDTSTEGRVDHLARDLFPHLNIG